MTGKLPRRGQSHQTDGLANDLNRAASDVYPDWPSDIVQRPVNRAVRLRADKFFALALMFRTPEAWAPPDIPRLALWARTLAYLERETLQICERRGGDPKHAKDCQSLFA